MPKNALTTSVYVCAAGAFGVFFRWLQLQLAFDEGLAGPSLWNVVVPLSIAAAAWLFRRFVEEQRNAYRFLPREFHQALHNEGFLFRWARRLVGAMMCAGAVLLLATTETDKYAGFLRILSGLGFLTGLAWPLLLAETEKEPKASRSPLLCLYSAIPVVFFAWWLVYDYRANSINSVIWAYVIEVVTVAVAMLAFFRLAGFAFEQPNTEKSMVLSMLGAYLCFMSLADSRYMGMQIMLLATALMLVLCNWIMTDNLQQGEIPKKEKPSDGFDRL